MGELHEFSSPNQVLVSVALWIVLVFASLVLGSVADIRSISLVSDNSTSGVLLVRSTLIKGHLSDWVLLRGLVLGAEE